MQIHEEGSIGGSIRGRFSSLLGVVQGSDFLDFHFSGELQVIGSIGSVAGGLIVGKEGPLVHVGACIASLLGQGGSVRYGMTWKWLRYLKNDRDRRDLVTCGAAAGVAAAFRAPVGGVLFALEEVTSWYDKPGCLFAATLFKP
jgi:H+/Cl- antiporter ClcA